MVVGHYQTRLFRLQIVDQMAYDQRQLVRIKSKEVLSKAEVELINKSCCKFETNSKSSFAIRKEVLRSIS